MVTAKEDKPLKLEPVSFDLAEKVSYFIEEVEPGRVFSIHFRNLPVPAGSFRGMLSLKTNYEDKPEISIPIRARFRKKAVKKVVNTIEKADPQKE